MLVSQRLHVRIDKLKAKHAQQLSELEIRQKCVCWREAACFRVALTLWVSRGRQQIFIAQSRFEPADKSHLRLTDNTTTRRAGA